MILISVLILHRNHVTGGRCPSKATINGKTVVITGANTGIGKETARELAQRGVENMMSLRFGANIQQLFCSQWLTPFPLFFNIIRGSDHYGMSGHGEVRGSCKGNTWENPELSCSRSSPRPGLREIHPRVCRENQARWGNKTSQAVFSYRNKAHSVTMSYLYCLVEEQRVDVLINNAGVMRCPAWKTEDGFDMQIGVNHLGTLIFQSVRKQI